MGGLERDLSKRFKSIDEFANAFCTAVRQDTEKKGGFLSSFFRK